MNNQIAHLPPRAAEIVAEIEAELPEHARRQYRDDAAALLRGQLRPSTTDALQTAAMAKDLAKRRGMA